MPRTELGVATIAFDVTPSDSTNITSPCRALYVGTGGDLNVLPLDNAAPVMMYNVPTGATLYFSAVRVYSTNTTASNIVALV